MTSRLPLPDGITSFTAAGRLFQPEVTDALATFEAAAARLPHLGPVLMELVRLRCARTHDCAICKSLRIDAARDAGVTEELASQLDDYERGPFDERTKIALRFVDTYLAHPGTLDAALLDQLLEEFTAAEIATLVLQIMKWSTQKMVVTLGMDRKPGMDPTGRTLLSLNFDESGAAVVGAHRGAAPLVQPARSVTAPTVGGPPSRRRTGNDMAPNPTLRELTGMPDSPAPLGESTLIMIDLQNTYTRGVMELEGVQAALDQAEELLSHARDAGIPIVHVMHDAGAGTPYDVNDDIGRIVPRVAPRDGEAVVVKNYPNSFVGTDLHDQLTAASATNLILAGFMTHMCVNSTARGAFNLGYAPSVVSGATATRELPGADGVVVPAAALQTASLAAIADIFGVVVPKASDIPR